MLNKQLYEALQRAFGRVTVFSRGEPATYTVRRSTSLDRGGRDWAENVHGGEHYEVTCPLCGMHKLWFSYLAGTVVTCKGASPVWFSDSLMICYYCNGTNNPSSRKGIWMKIRKGGEYFNVTEEEAFNGSGMFDIGGDPLGESDISNIVAFPSGVGTPLSRRRILFATAPSASTIPESRMQNYAFFFAPCHICLHICGKNLNFVVAQEKNRDEQPPDIHRL